MADEAVVNAIETMLAKDVISAKMAMAYITVDGRRYKLFQGKKLEAKFDKDKKELGILGRMAKGNKGTAAKGSGKLTIYKNTPLFDEMMLKFVTTGVDTYFDMQVSNSDPTSDAGRRTITLLSCNINSATVAAFDVDGDWLEDEIDFTFEGVKIPENFKILDGMTL
nr:MAG TPA_asm: tail tube protein [Caudoviricetes sp.]